MPAPVVAPHESVAPVTPARVVRFWELVKAVRAPEPSAEPEPEPKLKGLAPSSMAEVAEAMKGPEEEGVTLTTEQLLQRFFAGGHYRALVEEVLFTCTWDEVEAGDVEVALGLFTSRWGQHVAVLLSVARISV